MVFPRRRFSHISFAERKFGKTILVAWLIRQTATVERMPKKCCLYIRRVRMDRSEQQVGLKLKAGPVKSPIGRLQTLLISLLMYYKASAYRLSSSTDFPYVASPPYTPAKCPKTPPEWRTVNTAWVADLVNTAAAFQPNTLFHWSRFEDKPT